MMNPSNAEMADAAVADLFMLWAVVVIVLATVWFALYVYSEEHEGD